MLPEERGPVRTAVQSAREEIREVIKRDGRRVAFDADRITAAIAKAFAATESATGQAGDTDARAKDLCDKVTRALASTTSGAVHIETIQDAVENALMDAGEHRVARSYILYREGRTLRREGAPLRVTGADGKARNVDRGDLRFALQAACRGLVSEDDAQALLSQVLSGLHPGMDQRAFTLSQVLAARTRIEQNPAFAYVAARLLASDIYREVSGEDLDHLTLPPHYGRLFEASVLRGIETGQLDGRLARFDLKRLGRALKPERDLTFKYMGLQVLYDRYLLHKDGRRVELPQSFWMRVAMGLCIGEKEPDERAIEFYEAMSTFRYVPSSPTLFNAGTHHMQLSSCFLTTVPDELDGIFEGIRSNALLSKWSGGIGNDWTPVRALGSHIRGTNGDSQGVVPFLKVANDTAVAVNQGGKRKGAVCAYLEVWHLDFPEFCELRRNVGDERRRCHDMNIAAWVPDLFMQRVREGGPWTLFSPDETPDLHDLYGPAFAARYAYYEEKADAGEMRRYERIPAVALWRKMLGMLFETGHPWITFKDPCNIRSPQDHAGVVHSSNLCTEITLNTGPDEIAVCNLGSVNLAAHVGKSGLDTEQLKRTVTSAVRMLDNVLDVNVYSVPAAKNANLRHRPVGLGIMGFQDALYKLGVSYASDAAVTFADESAEAVSYFAISASSDLARERGTYPSYPGSKWARGLLPIDTIDDLARARGGHLEMDRTARLPWDDLRRVIQQQGMRNSCLLAVAPTATIANISGVSQSIEPTYANLYVKTNLSGDFTVVNEALVEDLRRLNLWDAGMLDDLKYYDGSIQDIERIPQDLKERYRTAFEIDPDFLVACASRRQKWIDQSQSLNLYVANASGKKISDLYMRCWEQGLKTTYYLRSKAATQVEKATVDVNRYGMQPRWMTAQSASSGIRVDRDPKACAVDDPECEACQ